jgi:hypothetical protein
MDRGIAERLEEKSGCRKGFKGFHLWMCDVDMVGILTTKKSESGTPKKQSNATVKLWLAVEAMPCLLVV